MISKYDLFVQCGRLLPDEVYLRLFYYIRMGKALDLKNPVTFNEKLQWLKLHDRRPEYTVMVDKYAVKEYVAGRIGAEYVIPTLGVWDRFEDIDFSALPEQFVLKCTHDSGGIVIVRDKSRLDMEAAKRKLNKCLRRNYYYTGREYAYKHVPPRILAEAYIDDHTGQGLTDYKFYCFHGKPQYLYVSRGLENHETAQISFLTMDWEFAEFGRTDYQPLSKLPDRPKNFDRMLDVAERLSAEQPFVRVDLYSCGDRVYFSELTLHPCTGMMPFQPEEWDEKLGQLLHL